jgi:hypothetical protein
MMLATDERSGSTQQHDQGGFGVGRGGDFFLEREILGLRKCGFHQNSTSASAISTRYRVGARDLAFRASGSHLCIT